MNRNILVAFVAALALAIPAFASAQVPAEVPIQGYLTDDTGVPIDGSTTITFTIYDAASGGTSLHTEDVTVDADAGAFTAYLTPDLTIFEDNQDLYLGMAVDGGAEMSPLLQLATVPYAAVAGNAATLEGQSASDLGSTEWTDIQNVPGDLADGDDTASYSAGAGLSESSNQFSVDYTATQQRVSGTCGSGEYITAVNQDGTVVCATDTDTDTDTTYSAGTGLNLSSTTFSVAPGGITSAEIADGTIADSDISGTASIDPTKVNGTAATLNGGASFSGDVSANNLSYNSPKTGRAHVSASAFTASDSDEDTPFFVSLRGGIRANDASAPNFEIALDGPVELPQGAVVTEFNCLVYDSLAGGSDDDAAWDFYLRRLDITSNGPGSNVMATSSKTDTNNDSTDYYDAPDATISNATVDNMSYDYYVTGTFTPDQSNINILFHGCYVEYEVTDVQP